MKIRDLKTDDRPAWENLWAGYLEFYQQPMDAVVTEVTWSRLNDPKEPLFALVAEDSRGLIGMAHCVLHRGTWTLGDFCYLEDLFVAPGARNTGIGRALIEAVYARADELKCERVYWLTHETNVDAQKLYDKVARRSGFIQYRR